MNYQSPVLSFREYNLLHDVLVEYLRNHSYPKNRFDSEPVREFTKEVKTLATNVFYVTKKEVE